MSQTPDVSDRAALAVWQQARLSDLLRRIIGRSPFHTHRLAAAGIGVDTELRLPDDLSRLPFTTKADLVADQTACPPWGTVLSEPLAHYSRYTHTSGTTGHPLRWVDTAESWDWAVTCWREVYAAARVGTGDRVFFAFSFGPFYGFWTAFDAAVAAGALCIPAGGMSSEQRLALLLATRPTVLCCTPTYALRLAEVATDTGQALALREAGIRVVIVAGEPGGSIPATRSRIEAALGARVIDHHGLTEVGPVSFECWERPGGLHVNEAAFIAEVIDPDSGRPVDDGVAGELVLTNLGRAASPVLRYRTGDLVTRRTGTCACGRAFAWLDGGILGRADDMVTVRGVNVYPAAIEAVVRQFAAVREFRSTVSRSGSLRTLRVDIEASPDGGVIGRQVAGALSAALGLVVPVEVVSPGTLPRFEMKARRFVVEP